VYRYQDTNSLLLRKLQLYTIEFTIAGLSLVQETNTTLKTKVRSNVCILLCSIGYVSLTRDPLIFLPCVGVLDLLNTAYIENRLTIQVSSQYNSLKTAASERLIRDLRVGGELIFEYRFRLECIGVCILLLAAIVYFEDPVVIQILTFLVSFPVLFVLGRTLILIYRSRFVFAFRYPEPPYIAWICLIVCDCVFVYLLIYTNYTA
jgi:hypothetical protein